MDSMELHKAVSKSVTLQDKTSDKTGRQNERNQINGKPPNTGKHCVWKNVLKTIWNTANNGRNDRYVWKI